MDEIDIEQTVEPGIDETGEELSNDDADGDGSADDDREHDA